MRNYPVWRGIRNASLLIQIAARRERRADPAVRESVVSLLQKPSLCTSMTFFFCLCCFRTQLNVYDIVNVARLLLLG